MAQTPSTPQPGAAVAERLGAHGDAIKFVCETEGLNFREAVERLAGEVGLALPEESPFQRERGEREGGAGHRGPPSSAVVPWRRRERGIVGRRPAVVSRHLAVRA